MLRRAIRLTAPFSSSSSLVVSRRAWLSTTTPTSHGGSSGHGHAKAASSSEKNLPTNITTDVNDYPPPREDEIPTQLQQSVGVEREEYIAGLQGVELFPEKNPVYTHFGTLDNPIVVYTHYDSRTIGCSGLCPYIDEPGWQLWWKQEVNTTVRCLECGQAFALRPHPDAKPHAAHGGHGHH